MEKQKNSMDGRYGAVAVHDVLNALRRMNCRGDLDGRRSVRTS